MSLCPKCQTQVPDTAFGLYPCSNCKAVLAIDFDGNASIAEEQTHDVVSPSGGAPTRSELGGGHIPHITDAQEHEPMEPVVSTDWQEGQFKEEASSGPEFAEKSRVTPLSVVQPVPDFAQGEPHELTKRSTKKATVDFEDVVAFGNSEVSQGASGNFLYDILICEINSEDLRVAVREALTDKRFGWSTDEIMKKLRGGSVKIEKVNAIKASILVSRLKSYPLDISWTQNGIFEISP